MTTNTKIDAKEFTAVQQRNEELTQQVRHLETALKGEALIGDIVRLADLGYTSVNARAIAAADGDPMSQAPAGLAPDFRPHMAFKIALEQVLDGIGKAVKGFDYGGQDKNGRRRHFDGIVDQVDFYKRRIERLQVSGDMVVVVEGQNPRMTEAAQFNYDRIVELTEMANKMSQLQKALEEAHHLVSPDEPYVPQDERMERAAKEKEKQAKVAAALPDLLAKMGVEMPALDV